MNTYKINTKSFIFPEYSFPYSLSIAIDPGTQNGVSIYDPSTSQFLFAHTYSFWELIEFFTILFQYNEPNQIAYEVVIEDIIGNKPTFHRGGLFAALKSHDPKFAAIQIGMFDKRAQDVGGNKRDQLHIIEFLEQNKITVHKYVPKKKSKTKLTHEQFQQETGIQNRLNEHTRDSIMLMIFHLHNLQTRANAIAITHPDDNKNTISTTNSPKRTQKVKKGSLT